MFDLEEVTLGNDEYIDKSSAGVSQMFNNTWLCRYPRPRKVGFDNVYEFKLYFTPLLKDFDIKPVFAPVERVHQVILNMPATKDFDNKFFYYIDP